MKKALALLVLSLATLPSLADQLLMLHYRVGDGDITYTAPNGGLVTSSETATLEDGNTGNYAVCLADSADCLFTIAEIPAGQEFKQWWFYFYRDSSAITTNKEWWRQQDVTATNITWLASHNVDVSPYAHGDGGFVHIVADFSYIDYTLEYNGNGSTSGSMSSTTQCYTNTFNLTGNAFAKTGYTFDGWTNATITAALADQSPVSGAVFGVTYTNTTATLYAQWTPNTYNVTLNPGFEATATNVVQVTYDAVWPSLAVPNREGYRFLGWFTAENGGSEINTNSTYAIANNSTNYAHWIRRVTATFNDGRTGGTVSTQEIDAGRVPETPQAPDHTADGYYFTGWVPSVAAIYNDTTYTAEYSPYTYTVVFHADNGTGATQTQEFTYNDSQTALNTVAALGFSLEGYSFQNWTNSTGIAYGDGQQVSNLSQSGEYPLYAVWEPIKYTIAFDGSGATGGSVGSVNATYDVEYPIPANGYEKAGLDFKKWRLGLDGGTYDPGDVVSNLTTVAGDTVTFYAVWSEPRYIAFDGNGANDAAAMADDTMTFEGVETKTLVSNKFEKAGYTFAGWATNEVNAATLMTDYVDGAEVVSTNLWMDIGETNVFYAVWQTNTYTVVFNPNCASYTGEMADQAFVYDQAQALTVNGFTNEAGLAFAGWTNYTDNVGYADGVTISNLTAAANGTVTLFAVWDVGELSKAMHCDNLYWENQPNATNMTWLAKYEEGIGYGTDSCVVTNGAQLSYMIAGVTTNGVLSFKWKANCTVSATNEYDGLKVGYYTDRNVMATTFADLGTLARSEAEAQNETWLAAEVEIKQFYFGNKSKIWLVLRSRRQSCYIDQMTWTPEGSTVEPTEEDKPTISAFTATAGGFTLSVDPSSISDSFSYQILATNELVSGDWPVKTNLTAEAVKAGFDIVPEAGEPTMFFKVKVIAK